MTPSCAITGLGAVSCFGTGTSALLSGMLEGRDGLTAIERFSTVGYGVSRAALVPGSACADDGSDRMSPLRLVERFALSAAHEARADAGLLPDSYRPDRVALVLGTGPTDPASLVHELSEKVGDALGLRGPRLTVSTACASSTNAIGLGAELLAVDAADVVLAGGADVVTPLLFAGFHVLGVLSTEHCAPFSQPTGTVLGEGAAFVVLERERSAAERGALLRARLLGYGLSCDAFHETSPDPTGSGVARAIRQALRSAGLDPSQIDYVNAHGTGTLANDPAEWRALKSVLGPRAEITPVSSSKSFLGHAQSAAGALELLATVLCLGRGLVPHTLHHQGPRPLSPPDVVAGRKPRAAAVRHALSTSSAFAGANAALAIASPDLPAPATSAGETRPVWVHAASCIGGHEHVRAPRVTKAELLEHIPLLNAAGSDRSTLLLLALVQRLLRAASLPKSSAQRERSGLVLGVTRISPESLGEVQESVRQRGLIRLAPTGFSRMVLSAPAGACARAFRLKGPMSTLSTGTGSGLVALAAAARLVETAQADAMLGAGIDEAPLGAHPEEGDGSAGALLACTPPPGPTLVRWAGSGLCGPGQSDAAIRQALAQSGIDWESIDLVVSDAPERFRAPVRCLSSTSSPGACPASTAAFGVVLGHQALVSGAAQRVLIESTGGASTCTAIILIKEKA